MLPRTYCDRCGKREAVCHLTRVQTARSTFSSPAEYEDWCRRCVPKEERDPAYERAAARYDGTGRDWR